MCRPFHTDTLVGMTEEGPSSDHDDIIRLLCAPRTDDVRLKLNDLLYGDGEHTEDFPDNALDPRDLDRLTQQARQAEIDRRSQIARDRNARLEASRVAQRVRERSQHEQRMQVLNPKPSKFGRWWAYWGSLVIVVAIFIVIWLLHLGGVLGNDDYEDWYPDYQNPTFAG